MSEWQAGIAHVHCGCASLPPAQSLPCGVACHACAACCTWTVALCGTQVMLQGLSRTFLTSSASPTQLDQLAGNSTQQLSQQAAAHFSCYTVWQAAQLSSTPALPPTGCVPSQIEKRIEHNVAVARELVAAQKKVKPVPRGVPRAHSGSSKVPHQ